MQELETRAAAENLSLKDAERILKDTKLVVGTMGPLPTKQDREDLTVRLQAVRAAVTPRIKELRDAEEWKRWANVQVQEELCTKMEALIPLAETEPEKAANEMRTLQERWKSVAAAPRSQAETLWTRFKAAQDQVYEKCKDFFAQQAAERQENLKKKEALCARAEALADSTDWVRTADAIKQLQAEWKTIGPVTRGHEKVRVGTLPRRLRQVLHAPAGRPQGAQARVGRQPGEEGSAHRRSRAARAVDRVGQGRRPHQAAAGRVEEDRSGPQEQVGSRSGSASAPRATRSSSASRRATRWRSPASSPIARPRSPNSRRWCRPPTPTTPQAPDDLYAQGAGRARALSAGAGAAAPHAGAAGRSRQRGDAGAGAAAGPTRSAAPSSIRTPRAARWRSSSARSRRCCRPTAKEPPANLSPAEMLARQWREALAANTMGAAAARQAEDARHRAIEQEVRSAQSAWLRLGPLDPETRKPLQERFDRACRRFFEQKRRHMARV